TIFGEAFRAELLDCIGGNCGLDERDCFGGRLSALLPGAAMFCESGHG
ncbi:hypothetical protein A2U01_0089821, partial [Trifolium medium]|nr:hypothetical protein [Trifolium medium]